MRCRALALVVTGLCVAVIAAFAVPRGPDMDYIPLMAAKPAVAEGGGPLFVQAREVTIAEWNRCHDDGACTHALRPPPGGNPDEWPATGLNWLDVNEYLVWINRVSRHPFRLPTAREWHAMAEPVLPETPDPIFTDPSLSWASDYLLEDRTERRLRPSGSWSMTKEGIADLNGSVWEWTQDCYIDGSGTKQMPQCPAYIVGGEHEAVIPFLVRDPARGGCAVGAPPPHLGMRLVTDHPLPGKS
ncbi:formylglycine-generating enzyme family protein [Roseitalea porphyridii]|nr:SUMF1/EgtB/PvdO family nonheme iron enzyme [Roseitalea porphyridii]